MDLHTNIFAGYFHDVYFKNNDCTCQKSLVIHLPCKFSLFCSHCFLGVFYNIDFKSSILDKMMLVGPIHQSNKKILKK